MFLLSVSNSWGLSIFPPPPSLSRRWESSALSGTPLAFQGLPLWPLPTCSPFLSTLTHTPSSFSKYCLTVFFLKNHPLFFFFTFPLSPPEPEPWPHAWTIAVAPLPQSASLLGLGLLAGLPQAPPLPPSSVKFHCLPLAYTVVSFVGVPSGTQDTLLRSRKTILASLHLVI